MTLVEALNGPISHIQSCVMPTSQLACHRENNTVSFVLSSNRRMSKNYANVQQASKITSLQIKNSLNFSKYHI